MVSYTYYSSPDVLDSYLSHDVFARNSAGQLVHYAWSEEPPSGWRATNLTMAGPHAAVPQPPLTANPTFTSALAVYASHHRPLQVFARDSAGQLIQYSPLLSGWEASNPTLTASGPLIVGNPAIMKSDTDDHKD